MKMFGYEILEDILLIENPCQELADSLKFNIHFTNGKTLTEKFDDM